MDKQNINIIGFEILYNILEEIKINLSFEIYNYKNENEFLSDLSNNNKAPIIAEFRGDPPPHRHLLGVLPVRGIPRIHVLHRSLQGYFLLARHVPTGVKS